MPLYLTEFCLGLTLVILASIIFVLAEFASPFWKQKTGTTLKAPAPLPKQAGQPLPAAGAAAFLPQKPSLRQLFQALLFKSQPPL